MTPFAGTAHNGIDSRVDECPSVAWNASARPASDRRPISTFMVLSVRAPERQSLMAFDRRAVGCPAGSDTDD